MAMTEVFGLLGGLALFLYGMQMMSSGLEDAAGNRMKAILEKLTSNRIMGVGVGAVITAIIQSSSATTVMGVGLIYNSGMMTLKQAVWIIMGANIGTTITGQLVALDVGLLAPVFAFIGVAMIVFVKNPKAHFIGQILAGFGVLFIGMDMMGAAMKPLQSNEAFISLMTTFSSPAIGILAGAVFTAVIQSSSASVGILQKLAAESLIPLSSAVFVLFGMNIGTCITAVLAAIGTNRSAKRTTLIHLMFNIIGTAVFTALFLLLPVTEWIAPLAPGNPAAQIAHTHTLFNIATTLLLLPFGTLLAWLATRILPDKAEETAPARAKSAVPILVLSARSTEKDKVTALDLGANDYITKPFSTAELLARIRAALRYSRPGAEQSKLPESCFQLHDLTIEYESRMVTVASQPIHLTQTEFNILALLAQHAGKLLTYAAMNEVIWGAADPGENKKLQVNMANLRRKLGIRPGDNRYIVNELGVGYRMQQGEDDKAE